MNTNTETKIKVVLVGDSKVGKSTYVNMLRTGEFKRNYLATMGVEVTPFDFEDRNNRKAKINFWDTAGSEKFQGLGCGYYIGSQFFILMFDITNKETYLNLEKWYKLIITSCPDAKIIVCGSKYDNINKSVKKRDTFSQKYKLPYFNISSASRYNFEKPLEYILDHI